MAKNAHTPGDWWASPPSSIVGSAIMTQPEPGKDSVLVATCHNRSTGDAALLAAAPDLLAALQAAVALHDSFAFRRLANTGSGRDPDPEYIARARTAIAKAVTSG